MDHFLISHNLVKYTTQYDAIHDGDNLSDHSLVSMRTVIPSDIEHIECGTSEIPFKPLWNEAMPEQIEMCNIMLDNELNEVSVPWDAIHYDNMHCDDTTHSELLNKFS